MNVLTENWIVDVNELAGVDVDDRPPSTVDIREKATFDFALKVVARRCGIVPEGDILLDRRSVPLVQARRVLCAVLLLLKFPIGRIAVLMRKNHSTICYYSNGWSTKSASFESWMVEAVVDSCREIRQKFNDVGGPK